MNLGNNYLLKFTFLIYFYIMPPVYGNFMWCEINTRVRYDKFFLATYLAHIIMKSSVL